jgi:CheY-like chemotaxis protein
MAISRYTKPEGTTAPDATPVKKIDLLYVEDEDLNWEVTLLHLQERYNVSRARNAREAFEKMHAQVFHAILMDIQLGDSDLDGIELTKVLRGTHKGILPDYARDFRPTKVPIIFMTAYSARYRRSDLIEVGGDELVVKPIDFTHLGLCLSRCLLKGIGQR